MHIAYTLHVKRHLHVKRAPRLTRLPVPQAFFTQANKDGVSLHSHLAEVIHKLLLEKPADVFERFESTSIDVKTQHFVARESGLKVRTT